jgi:hypothetical protein
MFFSRLLQFWSKKKDKVREVFCGGKGRNKKGKPEIKQASPNNH